MYENLDGQIRTAYCGEFKKEQIGQKVTAMGWVSKRRDFGGLVFVDLRDRTGIIQVVFDQNFYKQDFEKVNQIRNEFVLSVQGVLLARDASVINEKLATGYIEIKAENLKILASSESIPFLVEEDLKVNDVARLKYRYLDLRRKYMQDILKMRSNTCKIIRNFLDEQGFIEIETPCLGKSTPEGARDYLVPSRTFPNKFFALPQSPQIYKQLLMLSGVDKYYQIARCFRDEDLRADRQPEFTQVDIELSFIDQEESVMQLFEKLVKEVMLRIKGINFKDKFLILTYNEAMDRFGSDKPDMRFEMELKDISEIAKDCTLQPFVQAVQNGGSVRVLNGKGLADKLKRSDLEKLVSFVKDCGAPGMSYITIETEGAKGPLVKFFSPEQLQTIFNKCNGGVNDIIFFVGDADNELVQTSLGKLRLHLAEKFNMIKTDEYKFLWVTQFPQFEYSETEKRLVAKHHPFTAPMDEDLQYLLSEPQKVRAKAYDIVVNGYELGGGSIRINNREVQEQMFTALGFDNQKIEEQFGFFVNAFKYGAPPHGGLAMGLDRLIMLLANTTDIKSVIAFPKIQTAMDLLTEAPNVVSDKQLQEIYISLIKPKQE